MIAGVALSPVTSVVGYHAQPDLGPAPAVATELPAPQAVSSAANIPAVRNDQRKPEKASRVVIIDPRTDAVVFRSVDAYTGSVIDQVPAQALLRRRAYEVSQAVQALIKGENPIVAAFAAPQNIDTSA